MKPQEAPNGVRHSLRTNGRGAGLLNGSGKSRPQPATSRRGTAARLHRAGYEDLVSVIPPGAPLAPDSKKRIDESKLGKIPGRRRTQGWVGYLFTKERIAPSEIDASGANIGLLGNSFPALDIDSASAELTELVLKEARSALGSAPARTSRRPRSLLVYRTEEPFSKMRITAKKDDQTSAIEWLGRGCQYLVHGKHPKGAKYGWEGPPLWKINPSDIPLVTSKNASDFLIHLAEVLRKQGYEVKTSVKGSAKKIPAQEELKAPSIDELRKKVDEISNDLVSRDEWIRFGVALKAASQDDPAAGLEMWLAFSARWEGGDNDPDDVRATWDSFTPPFRIGWDGIDSMRIDARFDFTADLDPPAPPEGESSEGLQRAVALATSLEPALWEDLPTVLESVHAAANALPLRERRVVKAATVCCLTKRLGSVSEAQALYKAFEPPGNRRGFVRGEAGRVELRPLTAEDVSVEPSYLVDRYIPRAAVGAIVSPFSCGKTWLVVALGLAVAFGFPWLGRETRQQPVIFLIAEGNHGFHERLFGWLVAHGLLGKTATMNELFGVLEGRAIISRYPVRFDDPEFEEGVTATAERIGAGLIIVDTLGKTLGSEQAENDNDVANEITGMLSRMSAHTACTTIFTHHVGHKDERRARGASGWEQGVDVAYVIVGTRESLSRGESLTLMAKKMRDGPVPPDVGFRLSKVEGLVLKRAPGTKGKAVDSAVVEVVGEGQPAMGADALVFLYVEGHPGCSMGAVREGVRRGNTGVDGAIADLIVQGAVKDVGFSNRHKYQVVSGWRVERDGRVGHVGDDFNDVATADDEEGA